MKIPEARRKEINGLVQSPNYDALIALVMDMKADFEGRSTVGVNEFETLKLTFMREGQVQALQALIDNLEKDTIL